MVFIVYISIIFISYLLNYNWIGNCESKINPTIEDNAPSPSPLINDRELIEHDNSVGTAFAPTTPGGKCLGNTDYLKWKDGGYDNFGTDMQICSESCTGELVPVNCGFLAECDKFPYRTCVTNCMSGNSKKSREELGLLGMLLLSLFVNIFI